MSDERDRALFTVAGLEDAVHRYLARYTCSTRHLERLLSARLARAARRLGDPPAAPAPLVAAVVARATAAGLLDDAQYAVARARALRRRGVSAAAIAARLARDGLGSDAAAQALAEADRDQDDADLAAALAFARRRRIGPFRAAEARATHRRRDLAALGRAGFSAALAVSVVDHPGDREL